MNIRLAFLLLASLACACSRPPDHLQTVMDFERHKNDGDLDSAIALFADEPTLHFESLGTIKGLDQLRGILEYDVALHTHLQLEECEVTEREVSCRVIETNDWLKVAGIDTIEYDWNTFAFSPDDRIESVTAKFSADSARRLGEAIAEFHAWGTLNKPLEYGALFSAEGNFVYSAENAEKVLDLLRVWREEPTD